MPVTHESITIDRPRSEVWEYLIDPANQTVWQTSLVEFERDGEGEPQLGERSRGVVKVAGRRVEWTTETVQVDSGKVVSVQSIEAPFPFTYRTELEDADGGTRVTIHSETESLGGFFGKLGDPIVQKMYSRDVHASLENLKSILEEA
jgi:uncharacterized membrane protein